MKREKLKAILLEDGYKKSTIDSILCGRRSPNPEKRYEYETKYKIPFYSWGKNIKSYLQKDDTKTKKIMK